MKCTLGWCRCDKIRRSERGVPPVTPLRFLAARSFKMFRMYSYKRGGPHIFAAHAGNRHLSFFFEGILNGRKRSCRAAANKITFTCVLSMNCFCACTHYVLLLIDRVFLPAAAAGGYCFGCDHFSRLICHVRFPPRSQS